MYVVERQFPLQVYSCSQFLARMFRTTLKPLALPLLFAASASKSALDFVARCDNEVKAVEAKAFFDTKGFPSKLDVSINKNTSSLTLAGVGMRRKNLYVTMVDVYQVGLYLSPSALNEAKAWNSSSAGSSLALADVLAPAQKSSKDTKSTAKVSTVLKFVRDVGRDSICDAFNDAFVGCDAASIKSFREAMFSTIADGSIKKGEDLGFFWLEDNSLAITKNGIVGKVVKEPELANRLLRYSRNSFF